ncbi:MAG: hypothetical protein QHI48_06360 [Bacteroidota bacterium]|nr:hypothetical protein [Bacteroidota bacterium]
MNVERHRTLLPRGVAILAVLLVIVVEIAAPISESSVPILNRIAAFSILVPLISGLWVFVALGFDMRCLLALVITAFTVELLLAVFSHLDWNSTWLLNIYTLLEFGLLMVIFMVWETRPAWRKIMLFSVLIFIAIWVLGKVFFREEAGLRVFDSVTATMESVMLIMVGMFALIRLTTEDILGVFQSPRFWFVFAILVYFTGNLIIFALGQYVLRQEFGEHVLVWGIHSVLGITSNLLYAWAFICTYRLWKGSH